jgi:hypothetical protein
MMRPFYDVAPLSLFSRLMRRANLLSSCGVIMPAVLRVWGMLINSPDLLRDSSATSDALFEFDDIAARLNQLRVRQLVTV